LPAPLHCVARLPAYPIVFDRANQVLFICKKIYPDPTISFLPVKNAMADTVFYMVPVSGARSQNKQLLITVTSLTICLECNSQRFRLFMRNRLYLL